MTEPETKEALTREQKLDACVQRISQEEGVPPFCEHANEVILRTLDLDGGSSSALARIILKDLGLTSQVLRVANSALYNHSGRPILSLPHGITMLGWDALRNLVSAVRYVDHFADRSPGLRELMLLSLLSAVHSRDIAAAMGYPRPEEAHICGLFRNLGEVLVACHCPEEYSRIILAMHEEHIPDRAACLRVLDFTWDEVGFRVAAGWNMPSKVNLCLSGRASPLASPLDACLASIANYARDLTHALYRDGASCDSLEPPWVVDTQGRRALAPMPDLRRLIDSARKETQETFCALGVPPDRLRLEHQAERARHVLESQAATGGAALQALNQAVENAARTVRQGDFELTAFIGVLLDAVCAAGFQRAVFGLVDEDRSRIRGRLAAGGAVEDVLNRFQFPMEGVSGPIVAALRRKRDVLVDCSRGGCYERSALVAEFEPAAFALLPIVIDREAIGCFYADCQGASPDLETARPLLARVREVIAAAIGAKSRGAGAVQLACPEDRPA